MGGREEDRIYYPSTWVPSMVVVVVVIVIVGKEG